RHRLRPLRPCIRGCEPQRRRGVARVGAFSGHRRRARSRPQGRAHERRPAQPRLRVGVRDGRWIDADARGARLRPGDRGRAARLGSGRTRAGARGGVRREAAVPSQGRSRRGGRRRLRRFNRLGMIHGRFQPFHNGHLEYLRGAAARSDVVFIGITNPDPARIKEEPSDPFRHLPESNPFSYVERLLMVTEVAHDEGISAHVIPFPVNEPELWPAYVPPGVTQYLRLFSDWGGTKLERMRDAGYDVVILDEGVEKRISGADVRAALRADAGWQALVPPGVARVILSLDRVTA